MDTGRFLVLLGELTTFEGRISRFWPKVAFFARASENAECFNLSSDARRERSAPLGSLGVSVYGESGATMGRARNALYSFPTLRYAQCRALAETQDNIAARCSLEPRHHSPGAP